MDWTDTVPQGDPETVVELPHCTLLGLLIKGVRGRPVMLGIKLDTNGQPESCAEGVLVDVGVR